MKYRLTRILLLSLLTLTLTASGPCRSKVEQDAMLISPQPTPEATPIENPDDCRCFQMPDGRIICNSACRGK
jgi:hypothetical protein